MLVTSVDKVHIPYYITKVFPNLIEYYYNIHLWESYGFLEGLNQYEKTELSFLLHDTVNFCFNNNIDSKDKFYLNDLECNILIPVVTRLYRLHRIKDFYLIHQEFKVIKDLCNVDIEEIKRNSFSSVDVVAELIALTSEIIADNLGFKHEEQY